MRQPKFRGYSIETKSWHYGHGWFEVDYTDEYKQEKGIGDKALLYTEGSPIECELSSMGQFTGIPDKHDKEIYNGDIVNYCFVDNGQINIRTMVIVYVNAGFKMKELYRNYWLEKIDGKLTLKHGKLTKYKDSYSDLHHSNEVYWTEVIGNIQDNPELMNA